MRIKFCIYNLYDDCCKVKVEINNLKKKTVKPFIFCGKNGNAIGRARRYRLGLSSSSDIKKLT